MRISRSWLIGGAILFGIYLVALLLFIANQANAQSRHVLWSTKVNQMGGARLSLDDEGRIYSAGYSDGFKVYNPDGSQLWSLDERNLLAGVSRRAVAHLEDGSTLLLLDDNPYAIYTQGLAQGQQNPPGKQEIIQLDAGGSQISSIKPGFQFNPATGMTVLEGLLVLEDTNKQLRAIDMTGADQWQSGVAAGLLQLKRADGNLLVLDVNSVSNAAELTLLDGQGSALWKIPLPGDYGNDLQLNGNRICYVDGVGQLRCLDADGNQLWQFQPTNANGSASSFPVAGISTLGQAYYPGMPRMENLKTGRDGSIAAIDYNGRLFLLDADGKLLSALEIGLGYDRNFAFDLERERIVACDHMGLRVLNLQGGLIKSNSYIQGDDVPLLDSARGQAYLMSGGMLYCVEY